MHITIDTSTDLTDLERQILQSLLGGAPAPAKKAAAAPKPEPEPEEDLLGTDDGPTLEDAVKRATELVAGGKAAEVKAALAAAGVKRVSELSGAKISTFLDAL